MASHGGRATTVGVSGCAANMPSKRPGGSAGDLGALEWHRTALEGPHNELSGFEMVYHLIHMSPSNDHWQLRLYSTSNDHPRSESSRSTPQSRFLPEMAQAVPHCRGP